MRNEWQLDMQPLPGAPAPTLDADQRAVVEHSQGPLLVLAGPGTGKTTTIVESVVARIERDGVERDHVLVLTFGRRAAQEVRERITRRLHGGVAPAVFTFHAFAYALVREFGSAEVWHEPPRLLSGAEEDARIRELLHGAVEDGSIEWPQELIGALPTVGLAREVRSFLARARERGLTPADIRQRAEVMQRPLWRALADLADMDQHVMDLENVVDYTELMHRAVDLASQPEIGEILHARYRAIYVDEYQDTDPVQVQLVQALRDATTCLVAVGDPDQAIYGFRGADVQGISDFPQQFRTSAGDPAPVLVLSKTRRFGETIKAVASSVLPQRTLQAFAPQIRERHRHPECESTSRDEVLLLRSDSLASLTAQIAHDVREAHLLENVEWSQMAILVRTGAYLAPVERALRTLGIPVSIAADDVPLRSEPAVAALLLSLRIALHQGTPHTPDIFELLTGPIFTWDPADLRHLGRLLRASQDERGEPFIASRDLIASAIAAPMQVMGAADLQLLPESDPAVRKATGVRSFLSRLREAIDARRPIDEILWLAWSGTSWPERLRALALAGSSSAHHDIDAVMAMFDSAERMSSRYRGVVGVRSFLDSLAAQEIPAEPIAERAISHEGVRVLTAHRAKGSEFDRVWVVGLQEGVWPDLRPRGTVLDIDALDPRAPEAAARMAAVEIEERNLLYVACTRARHQVTVAVIDSPDTDGEQPSRYVELLRATGRLTREENRVGRPERLPTWTGLVAEWRSALLDPQTDPVVASIAARSLRELAEWRTENGEPVCAAAHPDQWWGRAALTQGPTPVRDSAEPIALSGSALDTLLTCPLQWFAEKEAHAQTLRGGSTQFGSVVHAVAEYVAKEKVPADLSAMDALLDQVWNRIPFDAQWQSHTERLAAREALSRFLHYAQTNNRSLITTEMWAQAIVTVLDSAGMSHDVAISGFIDRLEQAADGSVWAIDLKTQSTPPSAKKITTHGQLGMYQLLVETDPSVAQAVGQESLSSGGAALVQLRMDGPKGVGVKIQEQEALSANEESWIRDHLAEAAQIIRSENFEARVGEGCHFCSYKTLCPARREGLDVIPVERVGDFLEIDDE